MISEGLASVIKTVAVSVPVPPGPAAVRVIVEVPLFCGVPVIAPVEALIERPAGRPVAAQLVAIPAPSSGMRLNATPTDPENT